MNGSTFILAERTFACGVPAPAHLRQLVRGRLFRLTKRIKGLVAAARLTRRPFPSSVDSAHFGKARTSSRMLADYAAMPQPRLGFYGVVDERMDFDLLAQLADQRPDQQIVIVGPVVKVSKSDLPRRSNLHYLGGRSYGELPAHLASWDVALMPFANNESTGFISPTKTPEYLAAGRPVVSTPITDVVRHHGDLQSV